MKHHTGTVFVVLSMLLASFDAPDAPTDEIFNDIVRAKLYLPDASSGYYRGVRFDWSGVIYDLAYKDHHYFGKWFDRYEPTLHDAIMGPVDAFDPIGYEAATTGGTFVKIGVGTLEKESDERYNFSRAYRLINGGSWRYEKKGKNSMLYEHVLNDPNCNYRYTKTLTLTPGKPELVIDYLLQNRGTAPIETNVFNHNFFVMDGQPTGPDFSVTLPFVPTGDVKGKTTAAIVDGKQIRYRETINKGEFFAISPATGYGNTPADYDILVSNAKTKSAVRIVGDQPIVKFVYWSSYATLCPEPYTRVTAAAGQEARWKITYSFIAD
jgi:hypothetical protein